MKFTLIIVDEFKNIIGSEVLIIKIEFLFITNYRIQVNY
jgi:hypothetical protein